MLPARDRYAAIYEYAYHHAYRYLDGLPDDMAHDTQPYQLAKPRRLPVQRGHLIGNGCVGGRLYRKR
jgi:hypothetical protein